MTKEEYNISGYDQIDSYINRECRALYDSFTNSILDIESNEEYCSKLFNIPNMEEIDILYRKMNKEQFKNFIKYVMKKEVDYQQEHCIRHSEIEKMGEELKSGFDINDNSHQYKNYDKLPVIHKFIYNQTNINIHADWYRIDYEHIDKVLDNKWSVTNSWTNQLNIFNLIHIYHMMDWDSETIIIVGG